MTQTKCRTVCCAPCFVSKVIKLIFDRGGVNFLLPKRDILLFGKDALILLEIDDDICEVGATVCYAKYCPFILMVFLFDCITGDAHEIGNLVAC